MGGHSLLEMVASFGAGSAGGTLAGLFGVGGGIILVPLLALLLGVGQHQAQGLSLAALLFPNSLPAVIHFKKSGVSFHWALASAMALAFLPGVWLGSCIANRIPPLSMRWGFVALLVFLAFKTWFKKKKPVQGPGAKPFWPLGLAIGLAGGICGGLLGIGGGIVMIPLMTLGLKMPQHEAQLTSLLVMLPPVGLPGVLVYFGAQPGNFPWAIILGLALGFQAGAFCGARIATRLSGDRLSRVYAVVMVLMAALLLMKA